MKSKIVIYQLNDNATDYPNLSKRIKKFPKWTKVMDRCWIVKSNKTASEIRTILSNTLSKGGKIFVMDLDGSWGTYYISTDVTSWLRDNLR